MYCSACSFSNHIPIQAIYFTRALINFHRWFSHCNIAVYLALQIFRIELLHYKISAVMMSVPEASVYKGNCYTTLIVCYLLYVDFLCSFWLYYVVWSIATMDIIKVFGDNLKKYRTAMGISQEAFADKCGMHRTYISAIECYRRSISLENIQRIADALEIETYKLFLEEK